MTNGEPFGTDSSIAFWLLLGTSVDPTRCRGAQPTTAVWGSQDLREAFGFVHNQRFAIVERSRGPNSQE